MPNTGSKGATLLPYDPEFEKTIYEYTNECINVYFDTRYMCIYIYVCVCVCERERERERERGVRDRLVIEERNKI